MGHRRLVIAFLTSGLIAALFLIPQTRSLLLFQLGLGLSAKTLSAGWYMRMDTNRQSPRNLSEALMIAYRDATKTKSLAAFEPMIEKYPNEPALHAYLLRYKTKFDPWGEPRPELRDKAVGPEWKSLMKGSDARILEQAIQMGKKLEPDNGYFDLYEAALRFAQKRDDEALAAVHRAAGKRRYDNHTDVEVQAILDSYRDRAGALLYWISPLQRIGIGMAAFPLSMRSAQTSRTVVWFIGQDIRSGRTHAGLSKMADLITLGGTMRDNSRWAVEILANASSIQWMAVSGAYGSLVKPITTWRYIRTERLLAEIHSREPNAMSEGEWDGLIQDAKRTFDWLELDRQHSKRWSQPIKLILPNLTLLIVSGGFLFLIPIFAALWLVATIPLVMRRRTHTSAGPNRVSIWLLALLPATLAMVFIQGQYEGVVFRLIPPPCPSYWVVQGITAGLKVFVVAMAPIIALAGIRRLAKGSRFDGFFARLKTGCEFAIQGLLIFYLLTMIILIPLTARLNHDVDYWMTHRVQMTWDYQPR